MKKNSIVRGLLLLASLALVVVFLGGEARAAIPEKINIQGVITNKQNNLPHANMNDNTARFELWGRGKGGAQVLAWSSTQQLTTDQQGFFNAVLDLPSGTWGDAAFGLKFTTARLFNGDVSLRIYAFKDSFGPQSLLAAPFAIRAKYADEVAGSANFLKKSGDTMTGTLTVGATAGEPRIDLATGGGKKLAVFNNAAATDFYGFGIESGRMNFWAGNKEIMNIRKDTGNVGIGTIDPKDAKLQVEGGSGAAIRGNGSGSTAVIFGNSAGTGSGVYGYSNSGTGVLGISNGTGKAGVVGQTLKADGIGVRGEALVGSGGVGVYGKGATAGGRFEGAATGVTAALDIIGPIKASFNNGGNIGTIQRVAGGSTINVNVNNSPVGKVFFTIAGTGGTQDFATIHFKNANVTADSFVIVLLNGKPEVNSTYNGGFSVRVPTNGSYTLKYLIVKT